MNKLPVNDGLDDIEVEAFDFIWEEWEEYKGDIPLWQHIFCGSIAGIMEHVFMYPLDTLKTYIQTNGYVKNKNSIEKCNIYNCESKNINKNINLKEVNGNNIMYTDKRKFCTSSIGCNSCIYNTSCNYDNIYNMKPFGHFNKDARNINTFNKIKIRKKIDINNSFNYSNIKIRDEKEITSCFMNKKLKKNGYLNKIVNNNSKSFSANNEYNKQIDVIENNYRNSLNKLPSTYCSDNKRIKLVMNNIEKYNCSKYYGGSFEKKSGSLNQFMNKSKKSLKEFTNNEKLNSGKIVDYSINKNYIGNKGIKKLLPFHCADNKLKLIKSKKIIWKYIIKRNQMCKNECKRNSLKFSNRNRRIHLLKSGENHKNRMNLNTRDIYVNQLKRKKEKNIIINIKNENNLLLQFVHRIKDIKNIKNPKKLMGVNMNNDNINIINILKNSINNVINKCLSNSTNANNFNIENGKTSFNLSMRKFIYSNDYINKKMNMLTDNLIKWRGNNNNTSGISTNSHFNSYGRNPFKSSTYKISGNYFFNILNLHKNNEKNAVKLFPHIIKNSFLKIKQLQKKKEFIKNFEGIRGGFSLISVNDQIRKNDLNNFSILRNSNKMLFNNICYATKNYKHNRYDKKIYLSNKRNYPKNCHNINSIYSAFNNNLKNINFVRNIFYGKNINRINISTSQNSGLIKNNVSNLYKGVNVVVLGCIPAHALYFSTFEYSKKYFSNINTNTNPIKIMKTDIGNNGNDDKITKIDYKLNDLNYFSIAICGFLATIAHDLIIAPIDTIKQRMQLGINKSLLDSIKLMKENGIRSLYLSLPITLLMNIPYQIIMICVNEKMKKHYFEYANGINGMRENNNNFEKKKNINTENISREDGLISNLKNMNDGQNNKLIKQHIEKDIYSMENLNINDESRYMDRGMENIDEYGVTYFCENKNNGNDLFKNSINKSEKESNNNYSENYNNYKNGINKMNNSLNFQREYFNNMELKNGYASNYNKNEFFSKYFNHITSYFVCAGIGGGIAAVATNPLDVIKTRIQTECINSKSFNFFRIVSNIYYKEGCRSFFKGSMARMALCVPASAISWGTYETMKQFFKVNFNDV
ncbi:mitochondrial carrier protein, putative [Plasmodium berghei]|uniref:Mitochondrial carrier protein, putative n=2 Tax=Plasmodium berghei TaxID=5821 RepID=A0A509AFR1_PLABA|nr:mitochondrial carrier protein, putative [Plasmodium berghei ANKA]SCL92243.1 mitochondrial carrier protein, putative [Plasmodium berghei]SCM15622.1 mitochondrial carrier protein, putative [Plasmodium berghei]SCN22704.1 mitochondrial carrier protein, putative [Plasmodium berghei]VUC54387.1 mitochondrial carrier protein, putative [Plasmodium berghei ANKA]|eukprot:XP_034420219.1 mitochondrial carrier protein, putative [Plasmodium berghei ANKA]